MVRTRSGVEVRIPEQHNDEDEIEIEDDNAAEDDEMEMVDEDEITDQEKMVYETLMRRSGRSSSRGTKRTRTHLNFEIDDLYKKKNMSDVDEIVDHLRSNFHEYRRQKLQPFTQCVKQRLSRIVSKSESVDSFTGSDDNADDASELSPDKKRLKSSDQSARSRNYSSGVTDSDGEKEDKDNATLMQLRDGKRNSEKKDVEEKGEKRIYGPRLSDLGGMDEVVTKLKRKVVLPMIRPELDEWLGESPVSGILLHGPPGCGKTTLAHAIANEAGVPFYCTDAKELDSGVSGEERIRELFSKAYRTAPSIVFIDEIDTVASKRENLNRETDRRIVTQLLLCMEEQSHRRVPEHDDVSSKDYACRPGHVVVIGATNRPDALDPALRRTGRFDLEIVLGVPDETARVKILSKLTNKLKVKCDLDLVKLARCTPGFVGADLVGLVKEALNLAKGRIICQRESELSIEPLNEEYTEVWSKNPWSPEEMEKLYITMGDFEEAAKMVQSSTKRKGFSNIPSVKWEDVGGLDSLRKNFERSIIRPIKCPEYYEKLGRRSGKGFLLHGPPGCGKTLIAKAVAGEAGANYIYIKGAELLSKYVGESEVAVRELFTRARTCSPCIIFFDEVDALTTKRGTDGGEGGGVMARVVNQLLLELDGAEERPGVYVIGATNRRDVIDPALLRSGRLDTQIYVPPPSADERGLILKALAKKIPIDATVDLVAFGKHESCKKLTGADLAALMNEAVDLALDDKDQDSRNSDGTPLIIEAIHLERALKYILVALGKKYGNDKANSYKYLIGELNKLLGYFSSIGEYIPLLYWVDCLRGLRGKVEKVADEVDAFLESVLGDHRLGESDNDDANKDFVSILLEIQKQNTDTGFSIDRDCIKAVILDMFFAGTETSSTTLDWTIAALIKNPGFKVDNFKSLNGRVEKVANELDDLLEGVVTDHIIALESNVAVNQDFVSILLENWKQKRENGFSIDKDCIKAVTFDMLAGGTDTTSTTLEWTMAMLMKNPDIMCKLQKEVRNISRGKSRITEDDLDKMQYLKAVIKESLRINIPVPLIANQVQFLYPQ
ncbi:Cell division control protein 48 isogeny C [Heracleum sosnowskyi]|uniref:Cell division control protein 48 isogeny C n=1 Tax=Heracleum sosnowskyi TaxID=360622 RepID=A0AAD8HBM2_9APIA|nr:Cell division control protein 48 isogeny C [Heracleum sosnowskyi]